LAPRRPPVKIEHFRGAATEGVYYEWEEDGVLHMLRREYPALFFDPGSREWRRECEEWAKISDGHIRGMDVDWVKSLRQVYRECGDSRSLRRLESLRPDLW
jgi:hypothetical protein